MAFERPCKLFVLLAATGLAGRLLAQPVISEFLASNWATWRDEDGDLTVDWIEIYNPGPEEVNLLDWSLTDDINLPRKWVFPSTNMPPDSYLIVNASGKDRAVPGQYLHANFSLSTEGEYLALISPEGTITTEFAPKYPQQYRNISYGYHEGRQVYFRKPTPMRPNSDDVFNEFVADTKFSVDRGFYEQPFEVQITCATEGATILWTTNGSKPSITSSGTNGFVYTGPIRIAGTTVLRAAAFKEGMQPSNVDTHTYLFLEDVLQQSPTGAPPPGWPSSWGNNVRDYGMDPDIVQDARWGPQLKEALSSIPTFSVVMDLADLFDRSRGIYANAGNDGRSWERECSLELLYPDGREGFQINAGIRIRGGFSRSGNNPKHAFRVFFRSQYGASKLNYPVFGEDAAQSFDGFDLRTFQNYSWSFQGDRRGIFVRDQWNRDTQLAMGHQAERGDFYHLYINGQYWGLYNTCERPEASYAASYYGGDKEDYDVIKVEAGPYTIRATDGKMADWIELYQAAREGLSSDAAYERVQGRNPDGTPNPEYKNLVDVDNLIDYMLVIIYGGNLDAPVSNFLGNTRPNNWYGIRHREGLSGGFKFFVHDAEHTLLNVHENRVGPWPAGDNGLYYSNPQWVWQKMWGNPEFRIRCADRIYKHFFNDGVLTPEACRARFDRRIAEIEKAVIAESARWGDAKRHPPLTQDDWRETVESIRENYLPRRTQIVLDQLRAKGLYPEVDAPEFNQHGGLIDPGFRLTMSASRGRVYYTTDGSDPRLRGGAVAPTARTYLGPRTLEETTVVKARALDGETWSALHEATFVVRQAWTNLWITEIMYHPAPEGEIDGDEYEFLELKNPNPFRIDVSLVHFTNGVQFVFPVGSHIDAYGFAVLVRNPERFAERYPNVPIAGVYTGGLANGGERLELVAADGTPLFSVRYDDASPWPVTADGEGFSLVPVQPEANPDPDNPLNWRASTTIGGSPGADDLPSGLPRVWVNEILTHTEPPALDAVELHNPGETPADVSHWWLTDDLAQPRKFRIPEGTVIPPGGYVVFDENDFNPLPGVDPSFSFSSRGEEVYLFSAGPDGELTGYVHGFAFGAAANGVSFGRYVNSVGEELFPPQEQLTLGGPNAGPRVGPVVISEIHYHPAAGDPEFVELKNITDQPVPLFDAEHPTNTWRLAGVGFTFPPGITLPPQGLLVVSGGDPTAMRDAYAVPEEVPVVGPWDGNLQDSGERLEVQRPDAPDTDADGVVTVPYITVDSVRYNDRAPWPVEPDGNGPSLERRHVDQFGDDPANWRASFGPPSPGLDNDGNRAPIVEAGPSQERVSATFPLEVSLVGSAVDDGLPEGSSLSIQWSQIDGPGRVVFTEPGAAQTTALLPGTGVYQLRLTASDGPLSAHDDLLITVQRPAVDQVLVAAGSPWRYLDTGTNLGTAWREPDYDDSAWPSGPAQLGYGDGDEATVLSFGPDSRNKYPTTYFRKRFAVMEAASATELTLAVVRDDGVVVYLNGVEVMRDNMPEGDITFESRANTAVGGADESTFIERALDPSLLVEGENVLAVEIHQANPTSSDISFDLQLEAKMFPADQPPVVDAGPDRSAVAGVPVTLAGSFQDDGLPQPPGFTRVAWSQIEGPAPASFFPADGQITRVIFPEPGTYRLRLSADDGAHAVSDEVLVTVEPLAVPLRITGLDIEPPGPVGPRLRFTIQGPAGLQVRLLTRTNLFEGDWELLETIDLGTGENTIALPPPGPMEEPARFFRLELEGP